MTATSQLSAGRHRVYLIDSIVFSFDISAPVLFSIKRLYTSKLG